MFIFTVAHRSENKSTKNDVPSKIRLLLQGEGITEDMEQNMKYAAEMIDQEVMKIKEKFQKKETESSHEDGANLQQYKHTLILKAMYNIEDRMAKEKEKQKKKE